MKSQKILTLTLNPAIDHILSVDSLILYNKNLVNDTHVFYGGKGINVANALGKLNDQCTAAGFIGKEDHKVFHEKLAAAGVESNLVQIDGPTRTNIKVMDGSQGKDTEFNQQGFSVTRSDQAKLIALVESQLENISWLAISGSLPPGIAPDIYRELIQMAGQHSVKTCLDASGKALKAGLLARPTLLRINRSELEEISGGQLDTLNKVKEAIQHLITTGIKMAVISLGGQGVLSSNGKESLLANVPTVQVRSLTGAGDTLTAGCLHALSLEKSFEEVLQFGSALATASTLSMKPGDFTLENLETVLSQTKVTTI